MIGSKNLSLRKRGNNMADQVKPVGQDETNFYFETGNSTRAVPKSTFDPATQARLEAFTSANKEPEPTAPLVVEPISPAEQAIPSPTPSGQGQAGLQIEPIGPIEKAAGAMAPPSAEANLRLAVPSQVQQEAVASKYPEQPKVTQASPELTSQYAPAQAGIMATGSEAATKTQSAYNKAAKAEVAAANAASNQAQAETTILNERIAKQEEFLKQQQDLEKKRQEFSQKQFEELQKVNDNIQKTAAQQVDPNRFWNNLSTGRKIMTGISVVLGQAFAGKGNENKSMTMFNNLVQQDIDAQKENIKNQMEGQRMKFDASKSLYGTMLQKFGDERQADAATRLAYYDQIKNRIEATASQFKSPIIQANAQKAVAALDVQAQQARQNFIQASQDRAIELEKLGATSNLARQKAQLEMVKENRERMVPGLGLALTKEDVSILKAKNTDIYDSISLLDDLKKLGNKPFSSMSPKARARADQILNILAGKMRIAVTGGGPLTEQERAMLRATVGDPTKILTWPGVQMEKINAMQKILQRSRDNLAKQYGIEGYKPQSLAMNE